MGFIPGSGGKGLERGKGVRMVESLIVTVGGSDPVTVSGVDVVYGRVSMSSSGPLFFYCKISPKRPVLPNCLPYVSVLKT